MATDVLRLVGQRARALARAPRVLTTTVTSRRAASTAAPAPTEPSPAIATAARASGLPVTDPRLASFELFGVRGGKFRIAVVNRCNFNCFFCHNEGMPNPREPGKPGYGAKGCSTTSTEDLVALMNAYTRLGGRSLNVTGGEPTTRRDIVPLLQAIDKRDTTIVLNSNASSPFVSRLLNAPKVPQVNASLHTTDTAEFAAAMGTPNDSLGATRVMDNIVALKNHGYRVEINFSLGSYNLDEWRRVLAFGLRHGIATKAIALVQHHNEGTRVYGSKRGAFVDPGQLGQSLPAAGCTLERTDATKVGGYTEYYTAPGGVPVIVKNIARGRLRTDMCRGCTKRQECGEGVYALRSGVDGVWKPCLLNTGTHFPFHNGRSVPATRATHQRPASTPTDGIGASAVAEESTTWELQVLNAVHAMVGRPGTWEFQEGPPT